MLTTLETARLLICFGKYWDCVDNVINSETVDLLRVVSGLCVDNVINSDSNGCFASDGTGT